MGATKRQYCMAFTRDSKYIVTVNAPTINGETVRVGISRKFLADLYRYKRNRKEAGDGR